MRRALDLARRAGTRGEIPVGAVVVVGQQVVGEGENRRESDQDATAHAEILALRAAAAQLGSWRLEEASVYVTLEPCPMCAGALVNARAARVIYGCADPKAGAVRSRYALCEDPRLNHRVEVIGGVLAEACAELLQEFFAALRGSRKPSTIE
jgi:tRNA(adenine34) deaminase